MRILTSFLLVCAIMTLARADDNSTTSLANVTLKSFGPATSCPDDSKKFNGLCFHYIPRGLSWVDAEKNCQAMNGNLASVHSFDEYQHIQWVVRSSAQDDTIAWIGGSDCQQESAWLWSDGTAFTFTSWCSGEPNNGLNNEHCLQMNIGDNNCWNDIVCSHRLPSVCATKL
ncbi:type-2 ice-structuring protein-like [Trachinotus anak]|uniref:type-2 ice-structuring protein-like n=1 Tax=Trachinotus anak TaxID=443729 RepID=UPI0039F1E552